MTHGSRVPTPARVLGVFGSGRRGREIARRGRSAAHAEPSLRFGRVPGNLPVEVVDVTGATAIAVGRDHACAVIGGGTVRCWGENEAGILGDGSPPPPIVTVLAGDD